MLCLFIYKDPQPAGNSKEAREKRAETKQSNTLDY